MIKKMFLLGILCCFPLFFFAQTISPQPYGIDIFFPDNAVLQKIKDAGIAWIHMGFDWTYIEPQRNNFNFVEADRIIDFTERNGISILAKIGYTPGWANGNKGLNYPADNINDWKSFVQTVLYRYRTRVKYWAIWNEPNIREFFAPGKDIFVQQVLLPAAQTIRAADPAAFIVGPELAHLTGSGAEWYFWLKYILDNAGEYFDIISHHIYEDLGVYLLYELLENGDKLIPAVKTIIEESGQGNKPFWITETGWNTSKFSEPMQSLRYLDMLQTMARKDYPQKLFFYEIIDDPDPNVPPWGILRSNGEAKPAYNVYREYIAGLYLDPGNPDDGKNNKKCYAEQTMTATPNSSRVQSLQNLRDTRDYLRGYSASAQKAVNIYYDLNQEFLKIALADSRVFNLGREILEQALKIKDRNSGLNLNQQLPETISRKTVALVGILKNEYKDTPIGPLAALLERNLSIIGQTPLRDLLEYYLQDDILTMKKIR